MRVRHDVPLAPRTTLGVGGSARQFARAETLDDVREALATAAAANDPVLVLGGGSNLVIRDRGWDGLVVEIAIPGVRIAADTNGARVAASAGVVWEDFVAEMVGAGLAGVECLSGIPGLVGATPIQNVGAYGQEVADTIEYVRALDRSTSELERIEPGACRFGYRTSAFRASDRWIVVEVVFRLARSPAASAPIRYPELARALGVADGGTAPLGEVRRCVLDLRRAKGMVVDPADPESRSAGSFFTNPIVDAATLRTLEARLGSGVAVPRFAAPGGMTKLAAAWLIEQAGFTKGYTVGRVGISRKHALALVNRGGATARELLDLAEQIQDGVRAKLGIELVPEPVVV